MRRHTPLLLISLVFLALVTNTFVLLILNPIGAAEHPQLKSFTSYEELQDFVKKNAKSYPYYYGGTRITLQTASGKETSQDLSYSKTNVQVEGVDEADVVKTDGEYLYIVSGNNVTIVKAYPAKTAEVLTKITLNGSVAGIFIAKDRLIVFEQPNYYILYRTIPEKTISETLETIIKVYDVTNRRSPTLKREVGLDGWYFNSRLIGDYVYAVITQSVTRPTENGTTVVLPKVSAANGVKEIPATKIYHSEVPDYAYTFTTIVALNVFKDGEEPSSKTIMMGATSTMYVSKDNVYLAIPNWQTSPVKTLTGSLSAPTVRIVPEQGETTIVYRISLDKATIVSKASGEVPGWVLNQFSMDEYNGYFRIATTRGQVWSSETPSQNNVYILNMNLTIVGRLEDLARGERIYSARFMGERGYLVTFKKVDPLFVIDLKDPFSPRLLGQLKVTGYSDYLHPIDQNHVIGIGKETVEAEEGDFAWYQGVKISLFDISDVAKPKEIDKYEIGDRGTDSPVLRDHKAFLYDNVRGILVIPVLVAEVDEAKYPKGVPPNTYGDYVWQGAYVFQVSIQHGLTLKGRITHIKNVEELMKSGYYFDSQYSVKRSLYIDDVLYTLSDKMIKMNDLNNLQEIKTLELP